ncbi:hypothetical protein BDR04DRAFT_1149760 [Suillus decipiens]|nr:hypothetical protein BDR04DRAFT_1149760 [Suillus decipiens]
MLERQSDGGHKNNGHSQRSGEVLPDRPEQTPDYPAMLSHLNIDWISKSVEYPAYATTFNESQGLTLEKAVLDLRTDSFAHDQLYTAWFESTMSGAIWKKGGNDHNERKKPVIVIHGPKTSGAFV